MLTAGSLLLHSTGVACISPPSSAGLEVTAAPTGVPTRSLAGEQIGFARQDARPRASIYPRFAKSFIQARRSARTFRVSSRASVRLTGSRVPSPALSELLARGITRGLFLFTARSRQTHKSFIARGHPRPSPRALRKLGISLRARKIQFAIPPYPRDCPILPLIPTILCRTHTSELPGNYRTPLRGWSPPRTSYTWIVQ